MIQQEIKFFWPLTEQIELPLDFTPSEDFLQNKRKEKYLSGVNINVNSVTTSSLLLQPSPERCGYWNMADEKIQYHMSKKPNRLTRFMAKLFFNIEWKDK